MCLHAHYERGTELLTFDRDPGHGKIGPRQARLSEHYL